MTAQRRAAALLAVVVAVVVAYAVGGLLTSTALNAPACDPALFASARCLLP